MKIHIGCGKRNFGEGWLHIDGQKYPHVTSGDVFLYDQEDASADLIYASHFIEYFDRHEVVRLLDQWHRVLKAGGVLRLAVPDFYAMAAAYFYSSNEFTLDDFLGPLYGRMIMGGDIIYHKTVYDQKSLEHVLTFSGFKNFRLWDFTKTEHAAFDDQSRAHLPHDPEAIRSGKFRLDKHILISLNLEAEK